MHWQRRGGVILAPAVRCVALENDPGLSQRAETIITRLARLLAASNRCPAYSPLELIPGAYIADDLPAPDEEQTAALRESRRCRAKEKEPPP